VVAYLFENDIRVLLLKLDVNGEGEGHEGPEEE